MKIYSLLLLPVVKFDRAVMKINAILHHQSLNEFAWSKKNPSEAKMKCNE